MSGVEGNEGDIPPRTASIVLVGADGAIKGRLPPVPVATPWWQDIEPVVAAVLSQHGVAITVLRMLSSTKDAPHGGEVTYLAETSDPVIAEPWTGELAPHALRQPYADPGGPAADLEWAHAVLGSVGLAPAGPPVQVRTWNLSSVWRIPTGTQVAWLKVVPPFFAHEGAVIAALGDAPVPRLLGRDGGRMLLAEILGVDLHETELPQLLRMVSLLVDIQLGCVHRVDELLQLGLPDWRGPALGAAISRVVSIRAGELTGEQDDRLRSFVADLPDRFARIAACGLPDTLIHGDFHPGNVRGDGERLTLLDWGDSGVGHPLLDQPAFLERLSPQQRREVQSHWYAELAARFPGSDPARAAALLAPIGAARQAVVYQRFLDNIEPSERVYHRAEPNRWLLAALAAL